eukprot:11188848-Alexandrium_andersonii.AAC.1
MFVRPARSARASGRRPGTSGPSARASAGCARSLRRRTGFPPLGGGSSRVAPANPVGSPLRR